MKIIYAFLFANLISHLDKNEDLILTVWDVGCLLHLQENAFGDYYFHNNVTSCVGKL